MDPREGRREQLARHMVERVERNDRVERLLLELERGEVRFDENGVGHCRPGSAHLLGRNVDAGHLEALGEALRVGHACAAAELEHSRSVRQPRHELCLPLPAWIADDPIAPLGEALADRVVATCDKLGPRIGPRRSGHVSEGCGAGRELERGLRPRPSPPSSMRSRRRSPSRLRARRSPGRRS